MLYCLAAGLFYGGFWKITFWEEGNLASIGIIYFGNWIRIDTIRWIPSLLIVATDLGRYLRTTLYLVCTMHLPRSSGRYIRRELWMLLLPRCYCVSPKWIMNVARVF